MISFLVVFFWIRDVGSHPGLGRESGGVGVLAKHLPVGVHRYSGVLLQLNIVRLGLVGTRMSE